MTLARVSLGSVLFSLLVACSSSDESPAGAAGAPSGAGAAGQGGKAGAAGQAGSGGSAAGAAGSGGSAAGAAGSGGSAGAGQAGAAGAGQAGAAGQAGGAGQGGAGGGAVVGELPQPPGVGTGPDVYVATDGDDSNDGLSLDKPVRTLAEAVQRVKPGSIVHVRGGTYEGFVVQDGSFGDAEHWVVMRPYQQEAVTVVGSGSGPTVYFYADSCDEENGLVNGDSCAKAYWRLEGLSMRGSPDGGGDGNVIKIDTPQVQIVKNRLCCSKADVIKNVRTADDTKIVGNEIWQDPAVLTPGGNAQGIDITGADRLLIAGNFLHDLTDIAMYAKGNARDAVFEGNLVMHTGLSGDGNAIMCGQSTDAARLVDGNYESYGCIVRNNVIVDVAGACVAVGSSSKAQVVHNTCVDTARQTHAALFLTNESEVGQASTDVEFRGNIVYQATKARAFTDSDELGMTDWSTLKVSNNLYFAPGAGPIFSLKSEGVELVSFSEWQAAFAAKTGGSDASLVADPQFAETKLYTLAPSSPARDACPCLAPVDHDGTPRPQGPGCEAGAHEIAP